MSYTTDTATKVHERQVAAVGSLQSLVVTAVETLSGLADTALKEPTRLSSTLDEVAAPLTKIVGTSHEIQAHAVASSRDWLEAQHRFQTALLDALSLSAPTAEAPKPRAAKKN